MTSSNPPIARTPATTARRRPVRALLSGLIALVAFSTTLVSVGGLPSEPAPVA